MNQYLNKTILPHISSPFFLIMYTIAMAVESARYCNLEVAGFICKEQLALNKFTIIYLQNIPPSKFTNKIFRGIR